MVLQDPSRPLWERAVRVPYHVLGWPLRGMNWLVKSTAVEAGRSGVFNAVRQLVDGVPGPFDSYVQPTVALSEARGWEGGLVLYRPHFLGRDGRLRVAGSLSTRQARDLNAGVRIRLDARQFLELGGGQDKNQGAEFYGLGWDSQRSGKSYFLRTVEWGGLQTRRLVGDGVVVGLRAAYSMARAMPSEMTDDVRGALEDVHAGNLPPGFGAGSKGWNLSLWLTHDTTLETGRPGGGNVRFAGIDRFQDTDGNDVEFWTLRVDVQQYFMVLHPLRTVAARVFTTRIANVGSEPVPFQRLVSSREPDFLRGYPGSRFTGEGIMGGNLEYRWPVYSIAAPTDVGLDAYLFYDVGQIYDGLDEIALAHLRHSGGFGLRAIGPGGGFALRLELGVSDESPVFRLAFNQPFQHEQAGIFRGEIPVPSW
ncbi:MAG: BamA/TamA family outer membrane protein [Candidatus Krumholzibacteriia bacterium]